MKLRRNVRSAAVRLLRRPLELLVAGAYRARAAVGRHEGLRRLYYRVANRHQFSELYNHERLLADRVRLDAYHEALLRHIAPGATVVDLGTGCGVLAFFAAAARPLRVHAVEHSTIIGAAELVAADNGIENVRFHHVDSRELELPEKVDVIVHEQMGHALFEELMVAHVADLRDRLLRPGGVILPAFFDFFVDPVMLDEELPVTLAWHQAVHGLRFSALEELRASLPPEHFYKQLDKSEFGHFLCEPEPVLSFDLYTASEDSLPRSFSYRRTVTRPGRLDGFCVHFTARFDADTSFSTSPFGRRTSWRVPLLRVAPEPYDVGDAVGLQLDCRDLAHLASWRWTATRHPASSSAGR